MNLRSIVVTLAWLGISMDAGQADPAPSVPFLFSVESRVATTNASKEGDLEFVS